MQLPFTQSDFIGIFAAYNTRIWPVQVIMYIMGAIAVVGLFQRNVRFWGRIILFVLSMMWLWTGVFYHLWFFSKINNTAILFGTLFFFQGFLFLVNGAKRKLNLGASLTRYDLIGGFFILYAMALYPFIGKLAGHSWPGMPVFGVTPCPVVIFTFGVLLFVKARVALSILLIPLVWSMIGTMAAIQLGMYEDFGLLIAGLAGTLLILHRNRSFPARVPAGRRGMHTSRGDSRGEK